MGQGLGQCDLGERVGPFVQGFGGRKLPCRIVKVSIVDIGWGQRAKINFGNRHQHAGGNRCPSRWAPQATLAVRAASHVALILPCHPYDSPHLCCIDLLASFDLALPLQFPVFNTK